MAYLLMFATGVNIRRINMNKKFLAVFAALIVAVSAGAFAKTGIGAQFGHVIGSGYWGAALTLKVEQFPCIFAIDAYYTRIGLTADWWFGNPTITTLGSGPLGWYYGLGLAAGLGVGSNVDFLVAGRGVIGLNWYVIEPLEIYLQIAAQLGVDIGGEPFFPVWGFPVNLGFRFWF